MAAFAVGPCMKLIRRSSRCLRSFSAMSCTPSPPEVEQYHDESKHDFSRYAPGPRAMDWASQPDPFRTYSQPRPLSLEAVHMVKDVPYASIFAPRVSPASCMTAASVSSFFYHSMALSAWKEAGKTRWSLRVNPSSGNLQPTEAYMLATGTLLADLPGEEQAGAALFHYRPRDHALELRCSVPDMAAPLILVNGEPLPADVPHFVVGLSSLQWREAWKYGMRAWRYCNLDAGHACAAIDASAAIHGWACLFFVTPLTDSVLGLNRPSDFSNGAETEVGDVMCLIVPQEAAKRLHAADRAPEVTLAASGVDAISRAAWSGEANVASKVHMDEWPQMDSVEAATELRQEQLAGAPYHPLPPSPLASLSGLFPSSDAKLAATIIRQRRSAVDMDLDLSEMEATQFYGLLSRLLPSHESQPWTGLSHVTGGRGRVHLLIFVHSVVGLRSGIYFLDRGMEAAALTSLRKEHFLEDFEWKRPKEAPKGLPLYRLMAGNARRAAQQLSCHQEIARNGAFSLGMLAETGDVFDGHREPHAYRRLYWEAGAIGHVLYLEAEANDLRGTGIGCFFDDPVHSLVYRKGRDGKKPLQTIYHFAFGHPIEDTRLRTLEAYQMPAANETVASK